MMKHLIKLALGGLLGTFLLAGDAEACHKKKCGCAAPVACAPAPVATCAPRAKKCGGGGGFLGGLCHKKKSCAPAPCATVAYNYAPTYYGAPVASGQSYPTPQATGQSYGMPQVPSKR